MSRQPIPAPSLDQLRSWASDYDRGTFYAEVKGSAFDASALAAQAARLRSDAAKESKR